MNSGIYKISNLVTNDFYVGSAVNLHKRFSQHKSELILQKHYNNYLQNMFNKYGLDNLSFEIIEYVSDVEDLIAREQFYIDLLVPKYNIRKIAESNLGLKWSDKTKQKLSEAKKGNKYTLGLKHTTESKLKMSASHTGDKNWMYGKIHSESTKQQISKSMKGKVQSEEHIKKRSKSFIVISPDGSVIEGINLSKFCKKYNLNLSNMSSVLSSKRIQHKGWKKYK